MDNYNSDDNIVNILLQNIGKKFDDYKGDQIQKSEELKPIVIRGELNYETGEIKVKDAVQGTIWEN